MSTKKSYDVILAGGGIKGCAIAYNLLKRDRTLRVLIIRSSRRSGFWIRNPFMKTRLA